MCMYSHVFMCRENCGLVHKETGNHGGSYVRTEKGAGRHFSLPFISLILSIKLFKKVKLIQVTWLKDYRPYIPLSWGFKSTGLPSASALWGSGLIIISSLVFQRDQKALLKVLRHRQIS